MRYNNHSCLNALDLRVSNVIFSLPLASYGPIVENGVKHHKPSSWLFFLFFVFVYLYLFTYRWPQIER